MENSPRESGEPDLLLQSATPTERGWRIEIPRFEGSEGAFSEGVLHITVEFETLPVHVEVKLESDSLNLKALNLNVMGFVFRICNEFFCCNTDRLSNCMGRKTALRKTRGAM